MGCKRNEIVTSKIINVFFIWSFICCSLNYFQIKMLLLSTDPFILNLCDIWSCHIISYTVILQLNTTSMSYFCSQHLKLPYILHAFKKYCFKIIRTRSSMTVIQIWVNFIELFYKMPWPISPNSEWSGKIAFPLGI